LKLIQLNLKLILIKLWSTSLRLVCMVGKCAYIKGRCLHWRSTQDRQQQQQREREESGDSVEGQEGSRGSLRAVRGC
jgi:hypothetical protein